MQPFTFQLRALQIELALKAQLPRDLANLVLSFLKNPVVPWDAFDMWVPEYDAAGNYGHVPQVDTGLPMCLI